MSCIFSVIIPAYNAEDTLKKTVESAVLQSLGSHLYEIIIIDDASTDATYSLMEQLAAQSDNIRVFKNDINRGLGATRNKAIEEAIGEYVTFLDSDDLLRSDALEAYYRVISVEPSEIVYSNIKRINEFGTVYSIASTDRHNLTNLQQKTIEGARTFCSVGAVYKKTFLGKYHIRFLEGHFYEDVEFSVKCVLYATIIKGINQLLYYWVVRDDSITQSISYEKIRDAVLVFERMYRIITESGNLDKFYENWKKSVMNFLSLTARRVIDFEDDPQPMLSSFDEIIKSSKIFIERGIVEEIITATSFKTDPSKVHLIGMANIDDLVRATVDAVVMVALADYHVRNYVAIARQLKLLGINSVICDLSASKKLSTKRPISRQEVTTFSDVPYFAFDFDSIYPLLLNARAYLFSTDWAFIRGLIFHLKECRIPTIALYEGINDDLLSEPSGAKKEFPYRHTDHLLLPGQYYTEIYCKQRISVVGLPSIHALLNEKVVFPNSPLAIINVNFSYGVLEHCREEFLKTAIEACTEMRIPFVISQHPADKANLSPLSVSKNTIYGDIKKGTFLISRFSTCILEALALGKPAIYHNPHGERYPKFQEPMGAFEVSTSTDTLIAAIKKVLDSLNSGLDVRRQAEAYLQYHANLFSEQPPECYSASAIKTIVEQDSEKFQKRILYLAAQSPYIQKPTPSPPKSANVKNQADKNIDSPSHGYKPPNSYFRLFGAHQFYRVAAFLTHGSWHDFAVSRRRMCANERKAIKALKQ